MRRSECDADKNLAYVFEELSSAEKTAHERHLAGCPQCRTEISQWRETLAAYPANEVLPDNELISLTASRMSVGLPMKTARPSWLSWSWLPATALAVLLVITIIPRPAQKANLNEAENLLGQLTNLEQELASFIPSDSEPLAFLQTIETSQDLDILTQEINEFSTEMEAL